MGAESPAVRSNSIAASSAGVEIRYAGTSAGVIPWDDIARVTATAFEVGSGGIQMLFRHVTFDLLDGEFIEVAVETEGLDAVLSQLGDHMELLFDDPVAATHELIPGAEGRVLARIRP